MGAYPCDTERCIGLHRLHVLAWRELLNERYSNATWEFVAETHSAEHERAAYLHVYACRTTKWRQVRFNHDTFITTFSAFWCANLLYITSNHSRIVSWRDFTPGPDTVSKRSADGISISRSYHEIFWQQSSTIYSVFESINTHFIAVLAAICRTRLLTPRS